MKITCLDDKTIIFLYDKIDFNNDIKDYFKKIFLFLKDTLNLEFKGSYLSHVYQDNEIGLIIEIYELEDYNTNEIDMKIELENTIFLYEIEDIFINSKILDKYTIITYNNKFYLKIDNVKPIYNSYLCEIGTIIYKNTENIIKYGREIPLYLI